MAGYIGRYLFGFASHAAACLWQAKEKARTHQRSEARAKISERAIA